MVMLDYEVLLLPEWFALQKNPPISLSNIPSLRLFGSFLNEHSLQMAWHLTSLDNREVLGLLDRENHFHSVPSRTIQLIFFPISRTFNINVSIKQSLINLLENHPREDKNLPDFNNLICEASSEVEKSQQEFINLYFNENISNEESPEFEFRVNKFLFGALTAHYLEIIRIFPQIEIRNHKYSGIPMNFSMDDFLNKILLTELKSIHLQA
ncbi:hypothetical protein NEF87_001585 [Candidatus Lokiarchaeum ossiferum]|uniref:Uncharacterized protein n=1 Tax=Candidatus Lokiarchaeum ossiferum TaxID=2951803 RepID=A0ABY6HP50_9ARCH|nr:hypothetical protein NEF87_001585 [Candidatus Lokiarchaeum sp. B-35]